MAIHGIYLASGSPRRAALLTQIGVEFQAIAAQIGEHALAEEAPEQTVVRLARDKALAVAAATRQAPRPVLGADTLVVVDGEALGKPADREQALQMLARLSGRIHRVVTGIALAWGERVTDRVNVSEVRFRSTTPAERLAYCETLEPLDKAGAYGVQGKGAVFIEHIAGSYSAVMGLPLKDTADLLHEVGLPHWLGR